MRFFPRTEYSHNLTKVRAGMHQSHKVPCISHLVFGVQNAAITSWLLPLTPLLAKWALSGYESFYLSIEVKKKNRFFEGVIHLSCFSPFPTQGALGD